MKAALLLFSCSPPPVLNYISQRKRRQNFHLQYSFLFLTMKWIPRIFQLSGKRSNFDRAYKRDFIFSPTFYTGNELRMLSNIPRQVKQNKTIENQTLATQQCKNLHSLNYQGDY